jgi:hypothetical protein
VLNNKHIINKDGTLGCNRESGSDDENINMHSNESDRSDNNDKEEYCDEDLIRGFRI